MAKGNYLTEEVRSFIAQIYLEHPDFGPTKIRKKLLEELNQPDRYFDPNWPGVSSVQKELTKIRSNLDKRPPETKRLDTPWSIGSLAQYPIPPEALPMVLRVCAQREAMPMTVRVYNQRRRQDVKTGSLSSHEPFSIRDALWVSRLSKLFPDPQDIWDFAAWCSVQERAYEAIGKSIDTDNIDKCLLKKLGLNRSEESKGGKP